MRELTFAKRHAKKKIEMKLPLNVGGNLPHSPPPAARLVKALLALLAPTNCLTDSISRDTHILGHRKFDWATTLDIMMREGPWVQSMFPTPPVGFKAYSAALRELFDSAGSYR